jgi:hypothetical protein
MRAFPLEKYVALLDSHGRVGSYKFTSRELKEYDRQLEERVPGQAETYRAVVLLEVMQRSLRSRDSWGVTDDVAELCVHNLSRILRNTELDDISYMHLGNDRFDKELAAASMRLICAGARKLHEVYLPLSLLRRNPLAWARCTFSMGRQGTLYRMHTDATDPYAMREFNELGWIRFLHRTAGLLMKNSVQGLLGMSWFYDPALHFVSPHLGYLRSIMMNNGAVSVRMGATASDVDAATRTSMTRRRLYESGQYHPRVYAIIWHRKDLLSWASQVAGSHLEARCTG